MSKVQARVYLVDQGDSEGASGILGSKVHGTPQVSFVYQTLPKAKYVELAEAPKDEAVLCAVDCRHSCGVGH